MGNILITSVGKRVSLVRAFEKEIKKISDGSKVFVSDAMPLLSAACNYFENSFLLPKVSDPLYLDAIIKNCRKNNIKLIIPTIDTELLLLSKNKYLLLENNIFTAVSSENFIQVCRNKRKIHSFFKNRNIQVAKEFSRKELSYPLYIKPVDGSRSQNNFVVKNKDELLKKYIENHDYMFLEYIDDSMYQEYTCDLYYGRDSNLKCVVPRKRIDVRDGEVNKGKTEKNVLIDFIKQKLGKIEGARGCLTAQFFLNKKSDNIIGIEINPRFGGGFPLSYLAGANYPFWLIKEYLLNEKIEPFMEWKNNLLMLRYDSEVLVEESEQ